MNKDRGEIANSTWVMKKLERAHRRLISGLLLRFNSGLTLNQIMKKHKILSLTDLYKFNASLCLFRVLKLNFLPFLFDKIYSLAFTHEHLTRYHANFRVPIPRTRAVQFNLIYQAITAWNDLPLELRELESYGEFKRKLRRHFVNS